MLYRSMGFRVAIDDLGEGFASLRLWSELRPEYVKADKHFVRGIAGDPVKLQFLRAIQHIAENSGSQVIAEGIERAEDFRVAKDIGIACGQGWFIGRPAARPNTCLTPEAEAAFADARVPVVATARLRPAPSVRQEWSIRSSPLAADHRAGSRALRGRRRDRDPVIGGRLEGGLAHPLELVAASPDATRLLARPCIEVADERRSAWKPRSTSRPHRAAGRVGRERSPTAS